MTKSEIHELFKSFNDLTCLIIGDVMVDAYIWGKVNRISPEAPVPVFEARKRENRLGGAANVALNIQALGAKPILCGIIGKDIKGNVFETVLKEQNLSDEGIIKSQERLTTCKTRIISSSHHMLRVDEEIVEPINQEDSKELIQRVKSLTESKEIDVVIFEDYDKGVLNAKNIQEIISFNLQFHVEGHVINQNAYHQQKPEVETTNNHEDHVFLMSRRLLAPLRRPVVLQDVRAVDYRQKGRHDA